MKEPGVETLDCGCDVRTYRDFIGRMLGMILNRGEQCRHPEHVPGHALIMPGRDNARPE